MADLVEVVSYHVDLKKNLADFLPVKERYTVRPFPAWSIIGVDALGRSLRSKSAVSPHFENDFLELVRFAPVGDRPGEHSLR